MFCYIIYPIPHIIFISYQLYLSLHFFNKFNQLNIIIIITLQGKHLCISIHFHLHYPVRKKKKSLLIFIVFFVLFAVMQESLLRNLSNHSFQSYFTDPPFENRAAVLIALRPMKNGEPEVLLTLRSKNLRNHGGEVALPGGKI